MLYQNKRAITLHMVSLLTLGLSIFVSYMIFSDLHVFFNDYSSVISGISWMLLMLFAGNIMLGCMLWLSGKYVLKITQSEVDKECIIIKTWSVLGVYRRAIYPKSILDNTRFYIGSVNFSHVPSVSAPWWKLKTPTGKTLVVDVQGDFYVFFKNKRK